MYKQVGCQIASDYSGSHLMTKEAFFPSKFIGLGSRKLPPEDILWLLSAISRVFTHTRTQMVARKPEKLADLAIYCCIER